MPPLEQKLELPQARGALLYSVVAKIAAAMKRRRVRAVLGELDDYMLKDIGIARSDIESIANGTYPPRR
jgi:uncharacterized protein YjiS (DUF1127 family)